MKLSEWIQAKKATELNETLADEGDHYKRLRLHTRFDRKLLGKLSLCAWTCLKTEACRLLNRDDVVPGKVSDTGQVVYQAEKQSCRAFPDPKGDGT